MGYWNCMGDWNSTMASEVDMERERKMHVSTEHHEALLARLREAERERDEDRRGFDERSQALAKEIERAEAAEKERDRVRAALIRSQEDHRAAVEALETYEERIGDIADHVLGLVPPDVPSIVKLDAIERRCDEARSLANQNAIVARIDREGREAAEARVAELEAVLTWYATAPRDEDGATMPLDTGERARAVLAKRS